MRSITPDSADTPDRPSPLARLRARFDRRPDAPAAGGTCPPPPGLPGTRPAQRAGPGQTGPPATGADPPAARPAIFGTAVVALPATRPGPRKGGPGWFPYVVP